MTLVDTNLLVYATMKDAPEHRVAREWLELQIADEEQGITLCWPVLNAFWRLITSPRVLGTNAVSVREGWSAVAAYVRQAAARVVVPGPHHGDIVAELAQSPGLRSDDVPDIEIAALAIEHGLVLASHDHGFRRFSGLRAVDPLS